MILNNDHKSSSTSVLDKWSSFDDLQLTTLHCGLLFIVWSESISQRQEMGQKMIYFCSFPLKCSKECPPSPWTALLVLAVDTINVVTKRITYRLHISCIVNTNLPPQNHKWFETENNPSQSPLPFITPFRRALTMTLSCKKHRSLKRLFFLQTSVFNKLN